MAEGFYTGFVQADLHLPNFFKAYGNTFLYAVGGTAIALIMTSLMAYPLSKTFLWGNKFFTKWSW